MAASPVLAAVDWAVAEKCLEGETRSGDAHVVLPLPHGVLLAVIDGSGHGEEAAAAAETAAREIQAAAGEPPIQIMRRCDAALSQTRGAVISLASFDRRERRLCWLAVGNVQGVLLRLESSDAPARETLLLRGGVVGYQLPPLQEAEVPVRPGDTLILATDGIRSGFEEALPLKSPPQQMADRILQEHARPNDDALVLVARFGGRG